MGRRNLGLDRASSRAATPARLALSALVLAGAGTLSCSDDDDDFAAGTVDYAYEYYYPYSYYYPTDIAYSSYYWSYPWDYDLYYYKAQQTNGNTVRTTIGSALRSLARGESVCPGQVTVTPKMAPPACDEGNGNAEARSGATLVFTGCMTADGTLDGTVDVQSTRMASEAVCSATTRITVAHTTTLTNVTFTSSGGQKVVIPMQTDTGTNTFTYDQSPTTASINSSGRMQVFRADGTLAADFNHNGTRMISYSQDNHSYTVSGTINTMDVSGGGMATLTGDNITRSKDCCRPTGGTLTVNRTGGSNPGTHTWTFGPTCGQVTFDGAEITPPACL
jgi:hypothetical protein